MIQPRTFDELVSWATWEIIESITKGKPLRSTVWGILEVARRFKMPTI